MPKKARAKVGLHVRLRNMDEWNETVNSGRYVLAYFTAAWCGPCQAISPLFAELATTCTAMLCVKIDVDENQDAAEAAQVTAMPTFQVWLNGAMIEKFEGALEDDLRELVLRWDRAPAAAVPAPAAAAVPAEPEANERPAAKEAKRARKEAAMAVDGASQEELDDAKVARKAAKRAKRERREKEGAAGEAAAFVTIDLSDEEREAAAEAAGRTTFRSSAEQAEAAVGAGRRVFVANLPYSITDAQIREAFAACGRLASVEWLNHRDSSHFKGSGFLTFETAEAAAAAVKLDGTKVSKRPMRVDLAASAAPPSAGAPTCVYVGNLPFGTDEKGLRAAFSSCGGILSVMIIKKGKASLRFKTAEGAAAAAARDGEVWEERPLRIIPTNALGDVGGNKSAEGKGKGKGKGSSGGRGGGDRGGGDAGGRGGGVLAVGEAAAAQAPASAAEPEGGEAPRLSAHARRKGPRERAREHAQRAAALE